MFDFNYSELFTVSQTVKMDTLTKAVHDVAFDSYIDRNSIKLGDIFLNLSVHNTDTLLSSFIGKVSCKLPNIGLSVLWDDFSLAKAKLIMAKLLVEVLISNGCISLVEDVEVIKNSVPPKFRKIQTVVINGTVSKKSLSYGLELEAGVYNTKSYNGVKLRKEDKDYMKAIASMPFKLSDVASYDLFMKGYSLKTDWMSTDGYEDRTDRHARYETYANHLVNEIAPLDKFYLPMKFDTRLRQYYLFQLEGARPQGKLWETLMIDRAVPKLLGNEAINHIKHIIYVTLYGRCSLSHSIEQFTDFDLDTARMGDPMKALDEAQFGSFLLLNKCAKALDDTKLGIPSYYMFGKDLTNSGLCMAAASFHSDKMLNAANLHKEAKPRDSHTEYASVFGIEGVTRKNIKGIHTALLHGGSNFTLAKEVNKLLEGKATELPPVDESYVRELNVKAYGDEVLNIDTIAVWGATVVGNNQSTLKWRTPDGMLATHRAYAEHVPMTIYSVSSRSDKGSTSVAMVSSMPILQDDKGRSSLTGIHKNVEGKEAIIVHKRGLFANITHNLDSTLLRIIAKHLIADGEVFLLKHDDYIISPDQFDYVLDIAIEFFKELGRTNYYQEAMESIAEYSKYTIPVPKLIVGISQVEDSVNFLMP